MPSFLHPKSEFDEPPDTGETFGLPSLSEISSNAQCRGGNDARDVDFDPSPYSDAPMKKVNPAVTSLRSDDASGGVEIAKSKNQVSA